MKFLKPVGYNLMVKPFRPEEKTAGGLYLPDQARDTDQALAIACEVVAMGDEAYKDKDRYPEGPWCQVGDWVLVGKYAGTARFEYEGEEYRFIPDDKILGVVSEPEELKRLKRV